MTKQSKRRDFMKAAAAAVVAGAVAPRKLVAQSSKSYAASGPAKAWTLPQRKGPPVSIDVHSHWAPEGYLKAKAELGRPDYADPVNHDMDRRVKWMNEHGVQTLVLTLGGFMPWQWVTAEQGRHIAQICNDAAMAAHTAYPERFLAGIEVPAGDPEGCLKELNRVAGKPGMVAVHLPNSLAEREYLYAPAFAPVLSKCEQLGLPLLIHPLDGEPNWYGGKRLNDEYSGNPSSGTQSLFPGLTNSVGETYEQATTVSKLIVSGTLDKYPNLQIVIGHAGGAFPYIAGRLDYRGGSRLKRPFLEYVRRFHFDSLTYHPPALRYLIDMVGVDRVVLGTDNAFGPGANTVEQPHSLIDQLNLSDQDRDMILRGNAKRLFKLG